jgi:iron complex transport system ATP-binding protein
MAGDLKPGQGTVSIDGAGLERCPPAELAKRRAIMTQQSAAVFNLTVRQVLELGLYAFSHWSPQKKSRLLGTVAQTAGITIWLDEPLTARSWGQQQRVHFARALLQAQAAWQASGQAWLLLDEPTASQDPWHQQAILAACREWMSWGEVGVVVVVHDLTLAAQWCDELLLLKAGRVLAQGPCREMLTAERLAQLFGEDLNIDVRWAPLPGVIIAR